MRYLFWAGIFLLAAGLCACNPTLNWRDVRLENTPLVALFPCKPDAAERKVTLGDDTVLLKMLGCEAGGATFTLGYADLSDPLKAGATLEQWKTATLGKLGAPAVRSTPFVLKGALTWPQSLQVSAVGTQADGVTPLGAQLAWFTVGNRVFQAAVYSDINSESAQPAVTDTFFSGLRLQ